MTQDEVRCLLRDWPGISGLEGVDRTGRGGAAGARPDLRPAGAR
jgi:hypothetical protein